ncbi:MAG: oligosaccharide flippase family protein [Ruminococcus sp.]|nr:oligosaccharide flippase family protein [Ruminococcus sp.]
MKKSIVSKNNHQFFWGAVVSYATIAFNILSGLLYTPWMIRTIGDDQYALYTLALSVINLFLLDFGIGAAVTKFLSGYYAENKYDEANRFMGVVYKVFFAISALIAICLTVFFFFIDNIYLKLTMEEIHIFKRLFIIVSVYSVISFPFTTFNSVLMANERFADVKLCNLISKVLIVVLIIVCLLCNLGVYSLVVVNALINCIVIGIKYILIRRKTKQRANLRTWDNTTAKSLFSFTVWVTVKELAHRCIFTVMPTIIAALIGSKEITLFSLAATLEGYVYTFADAVNGMFMPRVSKLIRSEKVKEKLTKLMVQVGQFHVFTLGLIYVGFLCVGEAFVDVWMGEGYEAVYYSALILIFPSLIDVPQQIARTTLLAKDIIKQQSLIYAVMAITNVVLAIVFLNWFGIIGASVAVCVSYLIRTAGMNYLYKKHLFIDLKGYFTKVYGKWIAVFILTVVLQYIFSVFVKLTGVLELVINGLFVCVVYIALYMLLHKELVKEILKRRSDDQH